MTTHVKVLAILHFVISALGVIGAIFSTVVLGSLAAWVGQSQEEGASIGAALLGITGIAMSVLLGVTAILCAACGWGLLKRRRWGRILGIVLAALIGIRAFPLGTVFGVYSLWVLLKKESETLFT